MKYIFIAFIISITVSNCNKTDDTIEGSEQSNETISIDGRQREYIQFLPEGYGKENNMPIVFVLHGGTGSPKGMLNYVDYRALANTNKFILIYPKGIEKNWNDGRPTDANQLGVDDVNFIRKLIDKLVLNFSVNEAAVFVTGISNGGFMASRLGCELSDKIKAFAAVAATIEANTIAPNCSPNTPISALYIHGTDDGIVPFNGGEMTKGDGGFITSHWEAIAKWNDNNNSSSNPIITNLPDIANDDTTITETKYQGNNNSEVISYVVDNGGHTWPGAAGGLDFFLGNTSKDMDAKLMIWEFFERHIQD
ncbi:MAG: PHB depolymerase family esterase [Flavobacteriaceae bacterium]